MFLRLIFREKLDTMPRPEHDYLGLELPKDVLVDSSLQNRVIRYTSFLIMAAERAVQELNVAFKEKG